ncbi:hypothetical protein Tco_0318736 [Tanacetum coccineum]
MTDTRLKPSVSPIPEELHMDDDTTADEKAYSSSSKDVGRDHIPTVNLRQSWWKPITEDRPATPEPACFYIYASPPENSLLAQIDDIATFMDCSSPVLNGRMPQTSHRSSGRCNPKVQRQQTTTVGWPALSISKMKASYYLDVSLEKIVLHRMWIKEECDRRAVWTHMRILSVIRFKVFPMYGYNYMKEDLSRRGKYEGFRLIIEWFNEIYKFSDGTLHQIDEVLDYRVKEFRVNRRNPGLDHTGFDEEKTFTEAGVLFAIQKRLKTRHIF